MPSRALLQHSCKTLVCKTLFTGTLLAAAAASQAIGVDDARGDFIASYTGSTAGDLDVLGAFVTYNAGTDTFVFSATMADDIGTTPGAVYVFGLDRGLGVAGFTGIGIGGVHFDAIVRFSQNGAVLVNPTIGAGAGAPVNLPAGSAGVFGSSLIGTVSGEWLPSNGLAKSSYTWNLWPRDAFAGTAAISDFAPDNSNLGVTSVGVVPEPASALLLVAGLAGVAVGARRRRLA